MIEHVGSVTQAGPGHSAQESGRTHAAQKLAAITRERPGGPTTEARQEPTAQGMNLELTSFEQVKKDYERIFAPKDTTIEYTKDDKTGHMVFKILNKETGEVLRQVPPQEILNFTYRLIEFLDGKVVDETA